MTTRPTPMKGQVWRVGKDRWYLRRRTAGEDGRVDFLAVEVNGKRRATLAQEFLEDADARCVEYISTPVLETLPVEGGIDAEPFFMGDKS